MKEIVELLKSRKLSISFAESCTGGLLAASIVDTAGSSEVFNESVVTYSNEAKMKYLNVSKVTLDSFGAVSKETAIEMARGVANLTGSDIGVGVTGIAGPSGGTDEKPVGLVYISVHYGNTYVFEHIFIGGRTEVRTQAVDEAHRHIIEVVK